MMRLLNVAVVCADAELAVDKSHNLLADNDLARVVRTISPLVPKHGPRVAIDRDQPTRARAK